MTNDHEFLDAAHARVMNYVTDLHRRILLLEEWQERNPEYRHTPLHLIPEEVFERDPMPDTKDIISASLFRDVLALVAATSPEARRG